MGLGRFERPTPSLSETCSNQLSYKPDVFKSLHCRLAFRTSRLRARCPVRSKPQSHFDMPESGPDLLQENRQDTLWVHIL